MTTVSLDRESQEIFSIKGNSLRSLYGTVKWVEVLWRVGSLRMLSFINVV